MPSLGGRGTSAAAPLAEKGRGPDDGRRARRWLLWGAVAAALALGAAGVLAVLTFDRTTLQVLRRVEPGLLAALAALMSGGWLAAAGRVHLLARSLGHRLHFRDSVAVAVSGEFGVAVSPAGIGGTVLRLATLRGHGVPLPEGTAVVAADLVLDAGVAALVMAGALVGLAAFPGSREMLGRLSGDLDPRLAWLVGALVTLVVAMGLAWRFWRRHRTESGDGERGTSVGRGAGLRGGVRNALLRVRADLATLVRLHPRTVVAGFVLALAQLLLRYSILPVVVMALGGTTSIVALYPLQGLVNTLAHLAVLPGGGGSAELGGGLALAVFLPATTIAPAVFLWRLFTFHWNVFLGGAVFLTHVARER